MKKFTYIIIVFIIFISFAGINIFADNVDKAKTGQKIFAQAIENNEITVSNNEDEDFKEIDEIIGNCEITDEEMSEVVGEVWRDITDSAYTGGPEGSITDDDSRKVERVGSYMIEELALDFIPGIGWVKVAKKIVRGVIISYNIIQIVKDKK